MSTRDIPHCPTHKGFNLPCVRCAAPVITPSDASSVRGRLTPTTTDEARRRRLANEKNKP